MLNLSSARCLLIVSSLVVNGSILSDYQDLPLLATSRDYGNSTITSVEEIGTSVGIVYKLHLRILRNSQLIVSSRIGNKRLKLRSLSLLSYPRLDLRTLIPGVRPREDGTLVVTFELKFGEEKHCFSNDDARSQLIISISADNELSSSRIDFVNCEALVNEVN